MATTKTKKANTNAPATTQPLAIPSMVRDPAPAPAPSNPADMLAALSGSKPATKETAKSKKRAEVALTAKATELVQDFSPVNVLADIFGSRAERDKTEIKQNVFTSYVDTMWAGKSQPANPALVVEKDGKTDIRTIYIVQDNCKVQADNATSAIAALVGLGVAPDDAKRLVTTEVSFAPKTGLRRFDEMVDGRKEKDGFVPATEAEKSVAMKVMAFVMALPKEERDLILEVKANAKVNKGFLERAASYAKSKEQLTAIFKVITPQEQLKGGEFGISDTPDERVKRLIVKAAEILGAHFNVPTE